MSKPKMTPWFPPEIKPKYVGEYNASWLRNEYSLRYWDGKRWSMSYGEDDSIDEKEYCKSLRGSDQSYINWRGLASDPEPKGWKP